VNEFNKKSRHYLSNVYQLRYGLLLLILVCTLSCESNDSFLPLGLEKSIHYDVKLINKEKKERLFKQSYSLYNKEYNRYTYIRSDGKLIVFKKNKNEIFIQKVGYTYKQFIDLPQEKLYFENNNILLKFPLKIGDNWITNDQTNLIMKLGYDRIYKTLLPIKVSNTIEGVKEIVNIKGKTFKNCIRVISEGKTSYNPGPPLDVINIKIKQKQWYCPKYGLIKMVREESSDSETMGNIFYEKKIRL
tara:strand:- start:1469 stop:2203 length:735 start_codon:yes stop_codon:yes gene_type:complete